MEAFFPDQKWTNEGEPAWIDSSDHDPLLDRIGRGNKLNASAYATATLSIISPMDDNKNPTHEQRNNPLHGVKLADMLELLVAHYGWEQLASRININCFKNDPSIKSSLTFLRKTPWARDKVERLYIQVNKI